MLKYANSAMGKTFTDTRGRHVMDELTNCYIDEFRYGKGDLIGITLINMWKHVLGE